MTTSFEPVRAPARVLQIIFAIATSASGLTLARLVALTGLPKTSLLSLLRSLEASNYVVNVSGIYRLGSEMYVVASAIVSKQRFLPCARASLQWLYDRTGETVQIGVLAADEALAESIDVIETQKPIRLSFPIGLRRPLYCSSIGKLLLAFQSSEWIAAYLANTELVPYTAATITSAAALRAELATIRRAGLSVSHGSMFEGSSGFSAPIWDGGDTMIGGISVVAPTYRIVAAEDATRAHVLAAGEEVSRQLGYTGAYPRAVAPARPPRPPDAKRSTPRKPATGRGRA